MSTSSATESSQDSSSFSSSSYPNSPISQHRHQPLQHIFSSPVPQRRRPSPTRRYYSSPLREDSPDSIPTQVYGLEQREPSIAEKPRLLCRFSHALDDIKEDFSLQLDPNHRTNKIRGRHRPMLLFDASLGGSVTSSGSTATASLTSSSLSSSSSGPSRSRPLSILSFDIWSPPTRKLSRRLSTFGLGLARRKRNGPAQLASISQPNLIGSSTDI